MSGTPRRRTRDADATRAALLARATREFADRGFDGARVDEIAEAAVEAGADVAVAA